MFQSRPILVRNMVETHAIYGISNLTNITIITSYGYNELPIYYTNGLRKSRGYELVLAGMDEEIANLLLENEMLLEVLNKDMESKRCIPITHSSMSLEYDIDFLDNVDYSIGSDSDGKTNSERFHTLFDRSISVFDFKGYKLITLRGYGTCFKEATCSN